MNIEKRKGSHQPEVGDGVKRPAHVRRCGRVANATTLEVSLEDLEESVHCLRVPAHVRKMRRVQVEKR